MHVISFRAARKEEEDCIRVYVLGYPHSVVSAEGKHPHVHAIDIELPGNNRTNLIRAELVAAQYALTTLQLGGISRYHGKNLRLTFSFGKIKKLSKRQLQDHDAEELASYGQFLQTRYMAAEIEVSTKSFIWANDKYVTVSHRLPGSPRMEFIQSELGRFYVTFHALERMVQKGASLEGHRRAVSDINKAFESMNRMLTGNRVREIAYTGEYLDYAIKRYGKLHRVIHTTITDMFFIVVPDVLNGEPIEKLVTCYPWDYEKNSIVAVTQAKAIAET